jgi:hypothetical protein
MSFEFLELTPSLESPSQVSQCVPSELFVILDPWSPLQGASLRESYDQ